MNQVIVTVDVVLQTIIGNSSASMDALMEQARAGEIEFVVHHESIYWALCSVRERDQVNLRRFIELLKHCSVQSLDFGTRTMKPTEQQVAHWREIALAEE